MTNPSRRGVGVHFDGDLRTLLIETAAERLADVGTDRLSMRDVARTVGVSHAALKPHFGDRAGLLTAVATEGFRRFTAHLDSTPIGSADDPLAVLVALTHAYLNFANGEAGYFAVMFQPALLHIDDPTYAEASRVAFESLRTWIARCQSLGWRPSHDTTTLAIACWSFAHGVTVLSRQHSLERHQPDTSLDGVSAITLALLGDADGVPPTDVAPDVTPVRSTSPG